MMADRKRLIIFDCDGTLVDSQHMIIEAMTVAFRTNGLEAPDPNAVRRMVGLSLADAIGRIASDHDAKMLEKLAASYSDAFYQLRIRSDAHEPLFDGAKEAVHALAGQGHHMGVATGKSMRGLVATLERHEIIHHFHTLQTADRNPGKPNPGMVEAAMRETGAERQDTLVIGDTTYDILMAVAAGVPAIAVGWGYHDGDELRQAGARVLIENYAELAEAIENL